MCEIFFSIVPGVERVYFLNKPTLTLGYNCDIRARLINNLLCTHSGGHVSKMFLELSNGSGFM